MTSMLELQDLYHEALVREIIEKTKSGGLTWDHYGGSNFQATEVDPVNPGVRWTMFVTRNQVGTVLHRYSLEIKKNGVGVVTVQDGPLPYTNRESVVKELYEMVEIVVLHLDSKLKEALSFVQAVVSPPPAGGGEHQNCGE